mgnify:FL=1
MIKFKNPDQKSMISLLWTIFSNDETKRNFAPQILKEIENYELLTFNNVDDEKMQSFIRDIIKKNERSSFRDYFDFARFLGFILEFEDLKEIIQKNKCILSVLVQIIEEIHCAEKENRELLETEKKFFKDVFNYVIEKENSFWENNENVEYISTYKNYAKEYLEKLKN